MARRLAPALSAAACATLLGGLATSAALSGCSSQNECPGATAADDGALTVCSKGPTLKGVDVSFYQGTVDWGRVKGSGVAFAYARVSDGTRYPDSRFTANWRAIKSAGLVRGAYQFFRASQDPTAQAELFIARLRDASAPFGAGDLPPALDLEVTDGQSYTTVRSRAITWLERVESALGRKPIVYTGLNMASVVGATLGRYALWIPQYGVTCPYLPAAWSKWSIWQYSSKGAVAGIAGSVDVNKFQGDMQQLLALAMDPRASDAGALADAGAGSAASHDAGVAPEAAGEPDDGSSAGDPSAASEGESSGMHHIDTCGLD